MWLCPESQTCGVNKIQERTENPYEKNKTLTNIENTSLLLIAIFASSSFFFSFGRNIAFRRESPTVVVLQWNNPATINVFMN